MEGKVIKSHQRGLKELGIVTANLPVDNTQTLDLRCRLWDLFWLGVSTTSANRGVELTYHLAQHLSCGHVHRLQSFLPGHDAVDGEVHVLHHFSGDNFYGVEMRLIVGSSDRREPMPAARRISSTTSRWTAT